MFVQVFAGQTGIPCTLQRFARNMPVNYAVNYADSWLLTNGADVRICAPFVVASVAQLVEQLTLNFAQCFQWFYHGLLFRDFS
jgi:hypothetical protein